MRAAGGHSQAPRGDLATLLSAETYVEPGLESLPSSPSTRSNNKKTRKTSSGNGSGNDESTSSSRKRLKRTSPEEGGGDREGEEEEKKRSRGRPRLDIKDETAADRRRTQIRLAQRAYRNRKENTIQILERKVQELQDTNEDMSNAFMRLHDFALSNGLVDQAPEFGRQLRATTEKFLALARVSNEESGKIDDNPEGGDTPRQQQQNSDVEPPARASKPNRVAITPPPDRSSMSSNLADKGNQPYGGFIVTHEPVIEDLLTSTAFTLPQPTTTTTTTTTASILEPEIITEPTLDNASFPFDLSLSSLNPNTNQDTNPLIPPLGQTKGQFDITQFNTFSGSLFPTLSAPTSYAFQEATFGRRFQRTGCERALVLLSMPHPPLRRFNRVFGFCLMLESKQAIYNRLLRSIQRTSNESLNYWSFPFYNLGGAGTQLTANTREAGQPRMGNAGTVDVMKPIVSGPGADGRAGAGPSYNMGPFDSQVTEVADKLLDRDMRVNPATAVVYLTADGNQGVADGLLGGGEYFDCEEVEIYLRQKGVFIPPAADCVTATVDMAEFGSGGTATAMATGGNNGGGGIGGNGLGVEDFGLPSMGIDLGIGMGVVDPLFGPTGGVGTADNGISSGGGGATNPSSSTQQQQASSRKTVITVDINLLIYELTERTVCLGRTPGIKPEDINVAFWKATQILA